MTGESVKPEEHKDKQTASSGANNLLERRYWVEFQNPTLPAPELIRDIKLKLALEEQVELVKFGPGFIELHALQGAPQNLATELSKKMQAWTGQRWIVSLAEERGLEPLGARRRAESAQAVEDIRKHPVVRSVMHHFPDAEIKGVRKLD